MEWEIWVHVCVQKGGGEVVVGVRFTPVRLAPLDIPDIPTSGMLEAPPSSSSSSGAAEDSFEGFYVAGLTPASLLVEQIPHAL